ncbi:glycosyltransferase [Nakamurella silvestris]|nr:glycosyltransferase [Nakamurella silvestris]
MSKDQDTMSFRRVDDPVVSVVVPVYGQWAVTRNCLRSLASGSERTSFEVIVVDDCSPDTTAEELAAVEGVVVVSTPSNLGFIGACNLGAASARGEFLVFLNNDTVVHDGWLDALVDLVVADPRIGLVGSLLLGSDGTVQESGGIIWSDGTGFNYGRGLPATAGQVHAIRDVDYCSGASILVRRELFERLGAFDERYSPAYYEDADLAFAVRAAGYRVVVQPESVVTHLEGVSNGTETTGGLKRFQAVNREVFRRKWRHVLPAHGSYTGPGDLWVGRNRRPGGMILIVEPSVPKPDQDAGSRRIVAVMDELLDMGMSVHFAASTHVREPEYILELERKGITVLITPEEHNRFLAEAGPLLTAVMLCRPDVAWSYVDRVYHHAPDATIIYDTVDLHFLRMHRQAEAADDPHFARLADLTWLKEFSAMQAADVTLVVSEVEKALLGTVAPDIDVRVLSVIHDPVVTEPKPAGRSTVLFVGGYAHVPNVDAAIWAATEIMPLVRAVVPDATLQLVGSHMTPEIAALAGDGVETTGWVPDLDPVYRGARVVIAPIRFGAGVKGKVIEAIQHGVPVVGTATSFEGINLVPGTDVLAAEDAVGFAAAIVRLLTDDTLWTAMAGSGQTRMVEQFSAKTARGVLEDVLAQDHLPRRTRLAPRP